MTYIRESTVEKHLVKVAKEKGFTVRKLKWVGRRGAPDRVLIKKPGVLIFVEVKASKGELEDHQAREHNRLRADGLRVVVLWSKKAIDEYFK